MDKVLSKNKKEVLLGNQAIVRGALESGVQFVTTYPGTPASEIGDTFSQIAKDAGIYFEYSTNEKVALEAGAGASFSGLKTLVAMKHFGLNVASDFLMPLVYTGTVAPLVLVVADDPGCSSSAQSEQNTRAFAWLAHIPILEPATPKECKDFVKLGFSISNRYKLPLMIRETTRVGLQSGLVELGAIKVPTPGKGKFGKSEQKFVTMPPRVLEMKQELLEKIERIRDQVSEKSCHSYRSHKSRRKGIITSGVSYLYVMEALEELGLAAPVLKLGMFYPLPEEAIKEFIRDLDEVLVVEELEPCLEREIQSLAKEGNCDLEIHGKDLLPTIGELKPGQVLEAIAKICNQELKNSNLEIGNKPLGVSPGSGKLEVPHRHPQLCPGCPYWLVFSGVKQAVKEAGLQPEDVIYGGEIGCYMLAGMPPHNIQDYLYCMGSSVGIAHGISKATNQKVISFVGDSSFFHAGIPALLNVVNNNSNPLVIIMENSTTAMTGHQPHPGLGYTGMGEPAPKIKIKDIVKACGVKNLVALDPRDYKQFVATAKEFLKKDQLSVIIAQSPCLVAQRKGLIH